MFEDRTDAGRRLAEALGSLRGDDTIVLGLPRGGVVVAAEVARGLGAPLDVLVVRKLGFPAYPELAMGAIGEGGARVVDEETVRCLGVGPLTVAEVERREREELQRRVERFRPGGRRLGLRGRTAVIVDDGIATGATASAACHVAGSLGAARIVLAAPVGGPDALERVRGADQVICLEQPRGFRSVGSYYLLFEQIEDDEVVRLLEGARP
jgi:putative phosphoribosyl transferase